MASDWERDENVCQGSNGRGGDGHGDELDHGSIRDEGKGEMHERGVVTG
jgi:hypothetical protein